MMERITGYKDLIDELMEKVVYLYPEEADNVAYFLENFEEGQDLYYVENGRYYSDGDTLVTKYENNLTELNLDEIFTLTLRPGTYILAKKEAFI